MDWELERGKKTNGWKNHGKLTQDASLKRVYVGGETFYIPVEVPEEHNELFVAIVKYIGRKD